MNQFQNEILKFNVSDFAKSAKTHTLNGARISLEISEEESDTKLSLNILCCVMLLLQLINPEGERSAKKKSYPHLAAFGRKAV